MKLQQIQKCDCGQTPKLYYCGAYQLKCACGHATKWLYPDGENYVVRRNLVAQFWNTMRWLGV